MKLAYPIEERRTSLLFLAAALLLGGVPLVVYFTRESSSKANLWIAILLGLPFYALALYTLLRKRGIYVDSHGRRLLIRRPQGADVISFEEVEAVAVTSDYEEGPLVLLLRRRDGSFVRLGEGPQAMLTHRGKELAGAVGVPYREEWR